MAGNGEINIQNAQEAQLGIWKAAFIKSLAGAVVLPVNVVKTLMQLGYEPFPLEMGKRFIVVGHDAYFLPNGIKYMFKLAEKNGVAVLFRGFDCYIASNFINEVAKKSLHEYIDLEYPTLGGVKKENSDDFTKLSTEEAVAVSFRNYVRDMFVSNTAMIISRPLAVLFVRNVAQIIGGENKYTNLIGDIFKIGREEGLRGLFAGLAVSIVGTSLIVTVQHVVSFTIERGLLTLPPTEGETEDERITKIKKTYSLISNIIPFISNSFSYPYMLISSIMAVTGSQLACSVMPYTPVFNHYEDYYGYLKPNGSITRGSKLFLREHPGAIQFSNGQIFVNNKYFS
uniref:Uncharacterized protein n=1 Tax=Parastrongyloides trichosuri TaxID=131310 RepID=A0A0N5A6I2_PARTI